MPNRPSSAYSGLYLFTFFIIEVLFYSRLIKPKLFWSTMCKYVQGFEYRQESSCGIGSHFLHNYLQAYLERLTTLMAFRFDSFVVSARYGRQHRHKTRVFANLHFSETWYHEEYHWVEVEQQHHEYGPIERALSCSTMWPNFTGSYACPVACIFWNCHLYHYDFLPQR